MTHIPTEIEAAFFAGDRERSLGWSIDDSVRVIAGPNAPATGSVIAIRSVTPDVTLFVELADGSGIVVAVSDVERL